VYSPLELLLFIAGCCTIADSFVPQLINVPKATVTHVVRSVLSVSFVVGASVVVYNLKSRFCKEQAWQVRLKLFAQMLSCKLFPASCLCKLLCRNQAWQTTLLLAHSCGRCFAPSTQFQLFTLQVAGMAAELPGEHSCHLRPPPPLLLLLLLCSSDGDAGRHHQPAALGGL
jgi:hypothetical protein